MAQVIESSGFAYLDLCRPDVDVELVIGEGMANPVVILSDEPECLDRKARRAWTSLVLLGDVVLGLCAAICAQLATRG